jgi:hypothetical protein
MCQKCSGSMYHKPFPSVAPTYAAHVRRACAVAQCNDQSDLIEYVTKSAQQQNCPAYAYERLNVASGLLTAFKDKKCKVVHAYL